MSTKSGLAGKKKEFIKNLCNCKFDIDSALLSSGIELFELLDWLKNDVAFQEQMDDIEKYMQVITRMKILNTSIIDDTKLGFDSRKIIVEKFKQPEPKKEAEEKSIFVVPSVDNEGNIIEKDGQLYLPL